MLQYQQWVVEGRAQGDVSGRGRLLTERAHRVVLVAIGLARGWDRRDACLGAQSHLVGDCLQTLQRLREGKRKTRETGSERPEDQTESKRKGTCRKRIKTNTSITISASCVSPDMISLRYIR